VRSHAGPPALLPAAERPQSSRRSSPQPAPVCSFPGKWPHAVLTVSRPALPAAVADGKRLASEPPPQASFYEQIRMNKIHRATHETPTMAGLRWASSGGQGEVGRRCCSVERGRRCTRTAAPTRVNARSLGPAFQLLLTPAPPPCSLLLAQAAAQVHPRPRLLLGHGAGAVGHRRPGGHRRPPAGHPHRRWAGPASAADADKGPGVPCSNRSTGKAAVCQLASLWHLRRPQPSADPALPALPPPAEEAPSRLRALFAPMAAALESRLAPLRSSLSVTAAAGEAVREETRQSELVRRLRSSML
jgi:hypothetical protein